MDEQRIRNIIREEMKRETGLSQFGFNSVPFHTHNGVDSPVVYNPYNIYVGLIEFDDNPVILPAGWTVEDGGTGVYDIKHNLGTSLYVAVVSPILSVTLPVASVTTGANSFTVQWTDTFTGLASNTTFQFILIQINNGVQNVPLYTTQVT